MGGRFLWVSAIFFMVIIQGCASGEKKSDNMSQADRARMYIEVANGCLLEADPTGAIQNLTEAQKIDRNLPELHHSFALAYFAKHDLKTAIDYAKKAVELRPDYAAANNTLGKLLMDDGRLSEAVAPLERAANDPLSREAYKAWTNLGIIQYKLGAFEPSSKMMDRAVQESPSLACVAYYYRGHIKLRNNQVKGAIEDYDRATRRLCANFGDAYLALGIA